MALAANTPALDFETLLSRGYRPANVTRLIPRDKYQPDKDANKKKKKNVHDAVDEDDYNNEYDNYEEIEMKRIQMEETSRLVLKLVTHTNSFRIHLPEDIRIQQVKEEMYKLDPILEDLNGGTKPLRSQRNEEYYKRTLLEIPSQFHEVELGNWESQINWKGCASSSDDDDSDDDDEEEEEEEEEDDDVDRTSDHDNNNNRIKKKRNKRKSYNKGIIINRNRTSDEEDDDAEIRERNASNRSHTIVQSDALALLERPRNPYLDTLVFDETTVSWSGDTYDLYIKAMNAPLILELGVAGTSVGRQVYQNTILSAQHPIPALKCDAYRQRMEREWAKHPNMILENPDDIANIVATKGTLHLDKEQMQALIEARQKKRAQMAEDKKDRVANSMGTLSLGGGRGRTVTSSLMGPGGTERTGRPSRTNVSVGGIHEAMYIEQLDMVSNHTLYRDLSRVMLRQYLRPKLPLSVMRQGLIWQFQHRYVPSNNILKTKDGMLLPGSSTSAISGHNHASSGSQPLPISSSSYYGNNQGNNAMLSAKERLRNESDLSPSEGHLILLEFCEERPPVQLTKGTCTKIVNYYRGDKSRCPVSAGGGDRPARRKREGDQVTTKNTSNNSTNSTDRILRLEGPNRPTNVLDWVGKIPKKTQMKDRTEKEIVDILPEGITEILHPKVHGPFIGEIEQGTTLSCLISNLFVAPIFKHEPESTDFLMILSPIGGASRPGQREAATGVILRDLPENAYTVGQTEPRLRVNAPNTQGEKNFIGPFVSYQIACSLRRSQDKDGHGLRFDELQDRVLPSSELPPNTLRQRLKQVAVYDKNTQIWTTKPIGFEDYPGVEALAKSISPESVAAYESACVSRRRLVDLGVQQLLEKGTHTVISVGVAMVYLVGQLNSASDIYRKTKRLRDVSKSTFNNKQGNSSSSSGNKALSLQIKFYEKATEDLENIYKSMRSRHEVAQFIYEELQLAPWHLTGEFIDIHKKSDGTGMMKLTGLGDPSGVGEGFSFLREVDSKPSKSVGNSALNAEIKKITGTDDDLRKLTMKQMAALLRSYGMGQKQIDTLKRWDRVHVIRDLSTKAASDGIGDGLERFARGEKMKLSEQKQMYTERIQVIWKRQIAALSAAGDRAIGSSDVPNDNEHDKDNEAMKNKDLDNNKDESESDSSDDDLAAEFEEDMMGGSEANQLVATAVGADRDNGGSGALGQLRAVTQNQDLTKDAREFALLKKQREEEKAAQRGLQSVNAKNDKNDGNGNAAAKGVDRKVVRKRITKTYPDGRQTTIFKFVIHAQEVNKIMSRLQSQPPEANHHPVKEFKYEHGEDETIPGHAMFEDEDDFEYSSKGFKHGGSRRRPGSGGGGGGNSGGGGGVNKIRRGAAGRVTPRGTVGSGNSNVARSLTLGKLKTKISKEDRIKKRKREEEELEVYSNSAKRKGTNNRRERGSIRERRPHVIFAEKLEQIRNAVEARPYAGPFLKAVNRRIIPRYYEVISHPIDLSTIRDKIKRYEYRTADSIVKDFELMKNNAVKFNGAQNQIAEEAVEIFKFVKDQIEASRSEFNPLETEVAELMSSGKNKFQQSKGGDGKSKNKSPNNKIKSLKVKKSSSSTPTSATAQSSTSGNNRSSILELDGIDIDDLAMIDADDDDDNVLNNVDQADSDDDNDDESLGDFDM